MSVHDFMPVKVESDITAYNILEYNPYRMNKRGNSYLYIVYRDKNNDKKVAKIKNPEAEIYFVKEPYRSFHTPREYIEMDKTYSRIVPFHLIPKAINEELQQSDLTQPQNEKFKDLYHFSYHGGGPKYRKQLLKWPYTLMSDLDVETYYWIQLGYRYHTMRDEHVVEKCFGDIENDIMGLSTTQCNQLHMDPVNACTLIFRHADNGKKEGRPYQVYTLLLRDHERYPQQADFERRLPEFYRTCDKWFYEQTVIKDKKRKIMVCDADYHITLYDTERELLHAIFALINREKPDVCEFWNMPYDMPKMVNRMKNLGMDPVEEISDSDFFPADHQFLDMHIDNRPINIADRNSYIRATTTTLYIDQMQNYAAIRKGRKSYGSNSLDNIAKLELGMGKLKFKKGVNVTNAAFLDYWNFVLYNIRDVWCQALIDEVTNDTMAIVYDMNQMNCPLHHLTKQTKYQRYIYYTWYLRKGFVPGNNVNVDYLRFKDEDAQIAHDEYNKQKRLMAYMDENGYSSVEDAMEDPGFQSLLDEYGDRKPGEEEPESEESIALHNEVLVLQQQDEEDQSVYNDSTSRRIFLQGGAVGNPNYNLPNGIELIDGVPSKHLFKEVVDMDFASEYPWAKFTRSMSRSTQLGRLIIPHRISPLQNALPYGKRKTKIDHKKYLPGGEYTSDYISQDYLSFGQTWYNLPSANEMKKIILAKYQQKGEESIGTKTID